MTKRVVIAVLLLGVPIALYLTTRPESPDAQESVLPGITSAPVRENVAAESASPTSDADRDSETKPESVGAISGKERPLAPVKQPGMPVLPPVPTDSSPTPPPIEEITGPHEELDNVQFMVRGYRDVLGENPFGNNAEITRALMGDNARQVKMPLPVGSHLNESGELVDRWGTPYFFHQLSATEMEIRSAGADQQMWTRDDLLTR